MEEVKLKVEMSVPNRVLHGCGGGTNRIAEKTISMIEFDLNVKL